MFHISTATVRQMTAGCTVCGLYGLRSDYCIYRTDFNCRLTINFHCLHSSRIPCFSFQAFGWPKFPQTNRQLLSPNYFGIGLNHPEDGSGYVFPKYRNTPSIGQQTQTQATGVTRPLNTTLTQHKDRIVTCCRSRAGWSEL
jgi:hypothetical protein